MYGYGTLEDDMPLVGYEVVCNTSTLTSFIGKATICRPKDRTI